MPAPQICSLTATELVRLLRAKELSALEVMEAHLAQIERVNPKLNAIITLTAERARDRAHAADDALARAGRSSVRCMVCRWRTRTSSRPRACAPPSALSSTATSSPTTTR